MQRRTQRRQKRRYHPVGVSSSQVSVAPTAAPPTRNTDVLSVLEDPQALLDLVRALSALFSQFSPVLSPIVVRWRFSCLSCGL